MADEELECSTCGKLWHRPVARGKKPRQCPECKSDPSQVKVLSEADRAAARAVARDRVDNLETMLKANGSHLSQQRPPRSYSLSEIVDRIERIEEWINAQSAEQRPVALPEQQPVEAVISAAVVPERKTPRRKAKTSEEPTGAPVRRKAKVRA